MGDAIAADRSAVAGRNQIYLLDDHSELVMAIDTMGCHDRSCLQCFFFFKGPGTPQNLPFSPPRPPPDPGGAPAGPDRPPNPREATRRYGAAEAVAVRALSQLTRATARPASARQMPQPAGQPRERQA